MHSFTVFDIEFLMFIRVKVFFSVLHTCASFIQIGTKLLLQQRNYVVDIYYMRNEYSSKAIKVDAKNEPKKNAFNVEFKTLKRKKKSSRRFCFMCIIRWQ